jgi:hypothetical protein
MRSSIEADSWSPQPPAAFAMPDPMADLTSTDRRKVTLAI